MKRAIGILLALTGACAVGPDGPDQEPIDPNPERIVCSASFKTVGTWTAGVPVRDLDPASPDYTPTGCWPVGTWTFTATLDNTLDVKDITGDQVGDRCGEVPATAVPRVEASYTFRVDRTPTEEGLEETYAMTGALSGSALYRLKVTEGGGGECEGGVEIYSTDNKQYWNFKPVQTGAAITGQGEYTEYLDAQVLN